MRLTWAVLALVLGSVACEDTEPVAEPAAAASAEAEPSREAARPLLPAGSPTQAAITLPSIGVEVTNSATNPVNARIIGTASVTGSVTIAGTPAVTAAISSLPPVTIVGTPSVAVAPNRTVALLAEQRLTIAAGSLRQWFFDTSEIGEVRVALRVRDLSNVLFWNAFSGSLNLELLELAGVENHTRVYRVPGPAFGLMISNENGQTDTDVTIAVYGRP